MWDKLFGWMVARSMPQDLTDPHQELIAAEAAENGIRQAVRLTALAAGVLLLLVLALVYGTFPLSAAPHRAAMVAAEAAKKLGAENASLIQANADLQKKIDELTRESDGFRGQLIEAGKQLATLRAARPTAESPGKETAVATGSQPPPRTETVASTAERPAEPPAKDPVPAGAKERASVTVQEAKPAPKPEPHAVKKVAAPRRARSRTAMTSQPGAYQCGDGRPTRDPARCGMVAGVPAEVAEDLDPRRSYQCGDGRTVRDPAQCHSSGQ